MHQIQRQIIEAYVYNNGDGFQWQREIERLGASRLPERLEAVFDQYSPQETVLIDRLDLDLGILSESTFEEDFLKAVEKELSLKLAQLSLASPSFNHFSVFDAFLFFLEKGTLPWWEEVDTYRNFIQQAETAEGWNEYYSKENIELLAETLRASPVARRRLTEQFSKLFLIQLTLRFFQVQDPKVLIHWAYVQRIFMEYTLFSTDNDAGYFYGKLIENLIFYKKPPDHLFEKTLYNTLTDPSFREGMRANLSKARWESFLNTLHEKFGEYFEETLPAPVLHASKPESADKEKQTIEVASGKEGDYYYITNGGLVLLAPFLAEYLKKCEVADDSRVLNPDTAVQLIQYLATGQATTAEYELVLNKVLCGIPIHEPVAEGIRLTEAQKQQANDVLNAALTYWPVMKNTSREGLQSSFLQRPAKLSRRSDEWLLQVEQAAYDMLLSDLPWNYSPVFLPWMPDPLWVEWS